MKHNRRRWWRLVRIAVSLSLMVWLVLQVDTEKLLALGSVALWPLIVVALLLQFGGVWLSAAKWWLVLRSFGQRVPYLWTVQAYLIGQFFNNFLPTTIGGDAVRVYQLTQRTRQPATALTSVLVERITGFFALTGIAAIALLVSAQRLRAAPAVLWGTAASLIVAACALLVALLAPMVARYVTRLPLRNVADWRGKLISVAQALSTAYRDRRRMGLVLLLSFGYQLSWIGVNYAIIRALTLSIPFSYTALIVPMSDIVGLAPLFLNNLGSRSGTFIVMLEPLGISVDSVVALSVLVYLVRMAISCLGGVLYLIGSATGTHQRLGADRSAALSAPPAHKV